MWKALRRSAAALPAAGAVLGVAMAAGSSVRPDMDRTAEAVSRITGGDLGAGGLAAIKGRLTSSQLAVAMRHDPNLLQPALYGLTPGWESLTLAGKPGLESGKSGLEARRAWAGDARTSCMPVIALSANAMARDIEKGLEAGFFRYLTKPIKVAQLMDALDAALQVAETTSGPAAHQEPA